MTDLKKLDPLLSIDDAARIMGISPHTCRKWVESGKLPSRKLGKLRRIEPEVLAKFIGRTVPDSVTATTGSHSVSVSEVTHAKR